MATYLDLYAAAGASPDLDKKIMVALTIKANIIAKLPTPTDAQKAFAKATLHDVTAYLTTVRNYIFAEYNTSTVATITGAADSLVQTAVNAAVDTLLSV